MGKPRNSAQHSAVLSAPDAEGGARAGTNPLPPARAGPKVSHGQMLFVL